MLRFILASTLIAGALALFDTPTPAQEKTRTQAKGEVALAADQPAREYRIQIGRYVKGMSLRGIATVGVMNKMQTFNVKDGQFRTAWNRTPGNVDEWTDTVLEIPGPGKLPSRLRRHYAKARKWEIKDGKQQTLPLEGRVVFIMETKDGKEVVQDEEGNPLPEELAIHVSSVGNLNAIVPDKPVRLNESWKADPRHFAHQFPKSYDLDAAKATGVGKLVKVFTKGGRQYGVLEYKYSYVPIRFHLSDKLVLTVLPGSKCTFDLTIEACIDGSLHDIMTKGRVLVDGKMHYATDVELRHDWTMAVSTHEIGQKK